jgi:toxin FitB
MTMANSYLLDTNVVSELSRKKPDAGVLAFLEATPQFLVSVILFHELAYGLAAAKPEQRAQLSAFVDALREKLGRDAIPLDLAIAEAAGRLRATARAKGRALHEADALIAATAMAHGALLVTRNVRDFERLDVPLLNPFGA